MFQLCIACNKYSMPNQKPRRSARLQPPKGQDKTLKANKRKATQMQTRPDGLDQMDWPYQTNQTVQSNANNVAECHLASSKTTELYSQYIKKFTEHRRIFLQHLARQDPGYWLISIQDTPKYWLTSTQGSPQGLTNMTSTQGISDLG